MARKILAVVAGYFAMAAGVGLTTLAVNRLFPGAFPPGQLPGAGYAVFNLIYSAAFALFGGYVTAAIAKGSETRTAAVLAGLTLALAVVSLVIGYGQQPLWYQIVLLVAMPPLIVLGGWLRARRLGRTQLDSTLPAR